MNTNATYNSKVQDDSEEAEKHLALLIHHRRRRKNSQTKNAGRTFQKT